MPPSLFVLHGGDRLKKENLRCLNDIQTVSDIYSNMYLWSKKVYKDYICLTHQKRNSRNANCAKDFLDQWCHETLHFALNTDKNAV